MELMYKRCAGLDVHQKTVVACGTLDWREMIRVADEIGYHSIVSGSRTRPTFHRR